jgi:hypothetical protein
MIALLCCFINADTDFEGTMAGVHSPDYHNRSHEYFINIKACVKVKIT